MVGVGGIICHERHCVECPLNGTYNMCKHAQSQKQAPSQFAGHQYATAVKGKKYGFSYMNQVALHG